MGSVINLPEKSDIHISCIGDLQIALMEDNGPAIRSYIERLDRESSNEMMRTAGEVFGFPTVEIEGVIRTSLGYLSKVFGYKTSEGLGHLLERWGIGGVKMGGFVHNVRIEIRRGLALDQNDNKSILLDYPAFLIGGMNSTNEEAKKVQLYLLRCERIARVGIVAAKNSPSPLEILPQPAHALVKAKLAKEAWRGNPIATYILEKDYNIPVSELIHRTDPELSELAGIISQHLHYIKEDDLERFGIKIEDTPTGFYILARTEFLYNAFLEISRRHNIKLFFGGLAHLGAILSRETDALELLGWRKTLGRRLSGYRYWKYEYIRPENRPVLNDS